MREETFSLDLLTRTHTHVFALQTVPHHNSIYMSAYTGQTTKRQFYGHLKMVSTFGMVCVRRHFAFDTHKLQRKWPFTTALRLKPSHQKERKTFFRFRFRSRERSSLLTNLFIYYFYFAVLPPAKFQRSQLLTGLQKRLSLSRHCLYYFSAVLFKFSNSTFL